MTRQTREKAASVVDCYSRQNVFPNAIADDHQATATYHSAACAVSGTVLPDVMTVGLEAQTKKGTHEACHVYTHLWLNLTTGRAHLGEQPQRQAIIHHETDHDQQFGCVGGYANNSFDSVSRVFCKRAAKTSSSAARVGCCLATCSLNVSMSLMRCSIAGCPCPSHSLQRHE